MEQKYNVAIERGVMMEEEIKLADRERETLRIEAQRLREELSDLKIETDVLREKIKKHESRHLSAVSTDLSMLDSPTFDKIADRSPDSTASSPLITTPPDTEPLRAGKQLHDPPSPPMSDVSVPAPTPAPKKVAAKTPAPSTTRKSRLPSADHSITPKPRPAFGSSTSSRPPTRPTAAGAATAATRTPAPRLPGARGTSHRIPASNSLTHIRSLTAQMQRLEARVQSARSKLPAPVNTPPRASPRSSVHGASNVPSTVTIRTRKRTVGSTASSSVHGGDETTPTNPRGPATTGATSRHVSRPSTSGVSRLSFGPLPNRNPHGDSDASMSRPSSRASISSYARPSSRTEMIPPPRPMSRSSISGARTPLGRPRSSIGMHGHSASISRVDMDELDEDAAAAGELRTPSRRGTYSRYEVEAGASGIPVPSSAIPVPGRRQSGGMPSRRTSSGMDFRASSRRSVVDANDLLEEETY
ncbi:NUDE protein [Plectosphaerella cucumerina]|uniref:NUDE protein n=1 Tax=Plectosphaerella cucumerina TaxID=40658 RepID=A0A8K0TMJ7_9PEZI|nr:NUDE protein [Plectosphaerella cucumerina]